jgi:hypothetical protein
MKKSLLQLLLVLSLLIPACSSNQPSGPKTPQALQPTTVSTALFQVVKPDGSKVGVTIEDLKTLPLKQVTAEGKVEEGPGLLEVLNFAGVTEFSEVTLTGTSSPVLRAQWTKTPSLTLPIMAQSNLPQPTFPKQTGRKTSQRSW